MHTTGGSSACAAPPNSLTARIEHRRDAQIPVQSTHRLKPTLLILSQY